MVLLSKLSVYLTAIVIFLCFRMIFIFPKFFLLIGFIALAVMIISIFYLLKKNCKRNDKLLFLITPVIFILSSLLVGVFLNGNLTKLFFSVIVAIVVFLYLENLFAYFYAPAKYHIYSLENISGYINLIAIFFLSSFLYGIKILFGISNIYLFIGLVLFNLVVVFILIFQTFWINKIDFQRNWDYAIIVAIILFEIYIIIFLLPSSFYVNGLIFTLFYYVAIGLTRHELLNKLEKRVIIKYISIGTVLFFLLLMTTKWT